MSKDFCSIIRKSEKHNFVSFINRAHIHFLKSIEKQLPIELSEDKKEFITVRVKEGENYFATSTFFWQQFHNSLNIHKRAANS